MQEVGFKEAGEMLNTPVSTLRRWVILLEEQGYTFNRDGKRRQLDWQDVGVLREVKLRLQEGTLEEAIQKAISSSVVTQEEPHPQESQPLIVGSDWEAFNTQISSLRENLFWHGPEQAVSTLLTAWRALKKTIGRE
ncbi:MULTISPECIES: hypothetical protein [Paenibacillus]|uniref:hypothetical protein n=1 Tax=Paenibacillus TaxID=44249 RepID=UPI00096FFEF0|nr:MULTISPECIES: hypothetical protein [Paenibacillus]OMD20198.1 hypothetical protein BJP48_10765 [Paenibacillus odorifer]OME07018.1 hypothetical protein BSK60_32060 [Paenibacillus odorifer]OMF84647.1 hypothetical protein BK147_33065 [Paenibacillus sp. FSL R7-0337]